MNWPIRIFYVGHGKLPLVRPGAVSVTNIFAVEISGVEVTDIADILPQIAADCGGKRQIVVEGVMGCVL